MHAGDHVERELVESLQKVLRCEKKESEYQQQLAEAERKLLKQGEQTVLEKLTLSSQMRRLQVQAQQLQEALDDSEARERQIRAAELHRENQVVADARLEITSACALFRQETLQHQKHRGLRKHVKCVPQQIFGLNGSKEKHCNFGNKFDSVLTNLKRLAGVSSKFSGMRSKSILRPCLELSWLVHAR